MKIWVYSISFCVIRNCRLKESRNNSCLNTQGCILSCKRNPEVGSLGRIRWLHEITRDARLLLAFYSAVLWMWPLEWPQGHFMAQDGCWSGNHVVSIRETREGKSAEEFNSLPFKDPPLKETNPSRSGQNVIPGTHLPASEAESIVAFLLLLLLFFPSTSHFQVSVTRKERLLLGKQSADCHISESLRPSLQCFVEAISNSWWLASRNKHQCTYQ